MSTPLRVGKVIDDCQNVSVSTLRAWKRAKIVHCHAFKWRSRVDRSKCSAVPRVSIVPITSITFITPVLYVFTDLQPVKPFFEFFDCLSNSEVAYSSKAVYELDDFLARCPRDHCFQRRFRSIVYSSSQAQYTVLDGELVEPRPVIPQVLKFAFQLVL